LINQLVAVDQKVPDRLEILEIRQLSLEDSERRMRRLLARTGEAFGRGLERADLRRGRDRTVVHLPLGGHGAIFHASGAIKISMGLSPMQHLYERPPGIETLTSEVQEFGKRFGLDEWVQGKQRLEFERLWQIKAQGASRDGKVSDAVLCRAIGAYRHYVGALPVWGAASVAISVAGGSQLDAVNIHIREATGEAVAEAAIMPPDRAAAAVVAQLRALMGNSRAEIGEMSRATPLRFGYFNLGKRKAQRVLAPVYVTTIDIDGEDAQGYNLVVPATDEPYLDLGPAGSAAPVAQTRRSNEPDRKEGG
jgi:hypothetical protein